MDYTGIDNKRYISVDKIFSIHYFEYACNFSFGGETHDFWEFICVDKGKVNIIAGEENLTLHTNELFFHEPNEFHAVHADGKTPPNLVVISFSCHDEIMQFLKRKKMQIDRVERELLGKIISEASRCFNCSLGNPYLKTIPLKQPEFFGARQYLFLYLEQFLIHLLRRHLTLPLLTSQTFDPGRKTDKQAAEDQLFNDVVKYLQQHLTSDVTIESICEAHFIGRSRLQKLFRRRCNLGIIEYFSYLKIEKAKEMIRMQNMNLTQISENLGYSSIYYFSRQFKKIAGMTPSEYMSSIKAISEDFNN